jgi:hypothetical protein
MPSHREAILAAARQALEGTAAFVTADRSRVRTLSQAECPAVTIYPGSESVEYESQHALVQRRLLWRVAIRCEGTDTDLDPLHMAAVGALAGNRFDELAVDTREIGSEWVLEEADAVLVGCDIEFETVYLTAEASQESGA